jgi:Sap, sulfolipid-1-addressing protein
MGTVIVLALAMATDPMRIGITLLLISRPRPILNLLVYWVGVMFVGVTSGVVVLTMMRDFAPALLHDFSAFAATPTVRHTQVVAGLLALLLATLINTGLPTRQRLGLPVSVQVPLPVEVPVPVGVTGDPSALLLQPSTPVRVAQWQWLSRAKQLLKGESLWVALAAGLGQGPAPPEYLVALVAILAAGGRIGTQIGLAVLFNIVMLGVCEITLVSYLAMPGKTQTIIGHLNSWVGSHRRQIISVIVGVLGVCLVVNGSS